MTRKTDFEIKGVDAFLYSLKKDFGDDKKVLNSHMVRVALETHKNAVTSIQKGGRSGRIYKRGSVLHQSSAPSEAPKSDTGNLVSNITFEKNSMTVGSRKDAPYGFWLEFGTSKMAARPWLQPAFDKAVSWFDVMIAFGGFNKRGR